MNMQRYPIWILLLPLSLFCLTGQAQQKPNIIFILADDLGYGSIGAFGQQKIHTPNLDAMARDGIKLTNFYANSICSPTRCSFITGMSSAHSVVRDNFELGGFEDSTEFGQFPLPHNILTLGTVLQAAGYRTAIFGKWGLGGPHSTGVPWEEGFDFFYGYLDQKQAHNYYPTHLWRNDVSESLPNPYFSPHQQLGNKDPNDPASYTAYRGTVYSCDTITSEALKYIRAHRDKPFFLYMAYTLPHMSLQVPEEYVKPYVGQFEETPYKGGYLPNQTPHATYAAMISLLDNYVGRIRQLLKDLHLDKNTLVIFTGDNGAAVGGGLDADYFNCSGILRGRKGSLYEGGMKEPFLACWPGRINPGSQSDHISAIWDLLPTFAAAAGNPKVNGVDGISMLPALEGNRQAQKQHEFLYWEIHDPMKGMQAVRFGDWKAVRKGTHKNPYAPIELYNLAADPSETKDVAGEHPDLVRQAATYMNSREVAAIPEWNFYVAPKVKSAD
jgi:arylsulfatase A-like enzyme